MKRAILIFIFAFLGEAMQAQTAVQSWVQCYNATGNVTNVATVVVVDSGGNVIVTGYSWNGSNYDYATLAYSNDGVPIWTNRYDGPAHGADRATAMAVDNSDHILVTGYSEGNATGYNYATVAYSSTGEPLWTNRYHAAGGLTTSELPYALAVDSSNNAVVTGYSWNGSGYDYATVAYSSVGVPLWTNRYNGPGNANDEARAIAIDSGGNVFVTGNSAGVFSVDYATVAYSKTGGPLWTNRCRNAAPGADSYAKSVALDTGGKLFVTGYSGSGILQYLTVAYSTAGVPLWTNRYSPPAAANSIASAIAFGGQNNVFVTGYSWNGSGYDYATVSYSSVGMPLWTNRYVGSGNGYDQAVAMAVDKIGNVLITGYSTNSTGYEYATVAYSSLGVPLWTNRYSGSRQGNNYARAIATDSSGNVFVTGYSRNGSNYDYATIKYALAIPLAVQMNNDQLVLSWTNAAFGWTNLDFSLQSAPTINITFTNLTGATSPYTNPITGAQQFFRLISN